MKIEEARRVVLDFSSHDPRIIFRLAQAVAREYNAILSETEEPGQVFGNRGVVIYPRYTPAWGTISYKLDPAEANPKPAPTFKPGALAKVRPTCEVPAARGHTVRLVSVSPERYGSTKRQWDVVVDEPGEPWHDKNFGIFEENLELLP